MGISLAPAQDTLDDPLDPLKAKKPVAGPLAPTATLPAIPSPTIGAPAQPVDRVKLATDTFNTMAASSQGAYDAASRDNVRSSAALGQIASGGLRTREGNLQLARGRDLDQLRERLVNSATEGSIADASTAYQQQLASSQQGLAGELGRGSLDVTRGGLALEKERFATGANQSQQQIDMARKQQEINTAFEQGRLTLAEKNQALSELQNSQQFGLEGQRIGLAREQLAQTGAQFGLSLAQQKELATLGDRTQNRQLDISSAQGRNMLLLELARIMGGTSGNVDPNFLAAVAAALGMGQGSGGIAPPAGPPTGAVPREPLPPGQLPYNPTPLRPPMSPQDGRPSIPGGGIRLAGATEWAY